jgi:hypothetical protein
MAKEKNDGRRKRKAAERVSAGRKRQRDAWLLRGAVIVIVAGIVIYGYRVYITRQLLSTVTVAQYPAGSHLAGPITYNESPPIGGRHNLIWQNCAVYDTPIHNEHAVHSLEHGAIWITYSPDLPAGQVQALKDVAADDFMLLSPYPGLGSPVVVTAWNHQLRLDGATDPRLRPFINKFKNNPSTTPEFGAPCVGGTSAPATADTLTATAGPTMAPPSP